MGVLIGETEKTSKIQHENHLISIAAAAGHKNLAAQKTDTTNPETNRGYLKFLFGAAITGGGSGQAIGGAGGAWGCSC